MDILKDTTKRRKIISEIIPHIIPMIFMMNTIIKWGVKMLSGLLQISGMLILYLVYGSKSEKIKSIPSWVSTVLSFVCIFWMISLIFLFSGISGNDTWICLLLGIGFPVFVIVWCFIARSKK